MRGKSKITKRKKPTRRKSLVTRCDDAWRELVKLRAGYKCEYCGSERYLNSHHHYSRRCMELKWDPENGVCLCAGHHTMSNKFSAHLTPSEFVRWIVSVRGTDWEDKLIEKHARSVRYTDYDLEQIAEKLEAEIETLKKRMG